MGTEKFEELCLWSVLMKFGGFIIGIGIVKFQNLLCSETDLLTKLNFPLNEDEH